MSRPAPHIVVSIVNYRTADLTIAAARSALDALDGHSGQVVITDNASADGSAERIEGWIAASRSGPATLVRSETNSGFSGGHNQAMAAAPGADFYLLLNSDAILRPGFFEPLLAAAAAHPRAGLFAPRIEWEDGTVQDSCFRFAGPGSELLRGAATGVVSRLLSGHVIALPDPPDPARIEWVCFAAVLLRGEMVRDIGAMDDGYFLYFEDCEYCLRAHRAGWTILHLPEARAVHYDGGSGPVKRMESEKGRLPEYYWRSRTRFLRQAHGIAGPLLGNLAWMAGRGIARMRPLAGRPVPPAHENEWRDLWTGFLTPLAPDMEPRP